ncbi:hypothetical protein WICMUC_004172 [Wickerhamomyces mucosus]|uniref:Histone chaperone RTT106 n=1 Tax=Wickerhamomyces mucosus TaxID=1378264 RepID=A0A9P8TB96_9ASCO|nr:hypothetical protein WICMUC_004172 [Wickerhamomyces mucosus]
MTFINELPESLKSEILKISKQNKDALDVFQQLYDYLKDDNNNNKRRKLTISNENSDSKDYYDIDKIEDSTIIFQLKDLSFQSPIRKKLNLTFSISPITQTPILSISKSNDIKPDIIITELNDSNIVFSTFLPIPEKINQIYFVLFYRRNLNNTFNNEPIVLTMNKDQINKQLIDEKLIKEGEDFKNYIQRQALVSGFKISETFGVKFKNSLYVAAHRGTKEGLLYLLPNHILFGFKKPIQLYNSKDIESFSYSSITRVTFNVTISLKNGEKHEYSMIDQQDFANIDTYIKTRKFQDNSMSEELKAKPMSKGNEFAGALAEAEREAEAEAEAEGQDQDQEEDSDDEEADANFETVVEVDDTSDVTDDENDSGIEEDEEDEEEDEEDEDREIELNSDDD